MQLIINGDAKRYAEPQLFVSDLLRLESVTLPDMVSVQVNSEFLERQDYATRILTDGDEIDFLYFMGGGQ